MKISSKRIISAAVAALVVAGALGTWSLGSSAAGATLPYTSQLSAAKATSKFSVAKTSRTRLARTASKRRVYVAPVATRAAASGSSQLAEAQSILAGLKAAHPILRGTTVAFGDAHGYQAVSYYQSGRIVISPSHTASLSRILNHEVWHVIDWRDNGRIDWGENIPPRS